MADLDFLKLVRLSFLTIIIFRSGIQCPAGLPAERRPVPRVCLRFLSAPPHQNDA